MAASAGGLQALGRILSSLPASFPAAIAIVLHLDPHHKSLMAKVLGRMTPLPVTEATEDAQLRPGEVLVATPDRHLTFRSDGTVALTSTERVRHVRPSADVLFESAARSFGPRLIAVVLTGTGLDGSDGVRAVKALGGRVIVQQAAQFAAMPDAAIDTGCADAILPLDSIAPQLIQIVEKRAGS